MKSLDNNKLVVGLFFDFAKAFDILINCINME